MKAQRLLFCIVLFVLSFTIARAQGITISGTVYDDGTEGPALGTPTNVVGSKPLYANLSYRFTFDSYGSFYVQASSPVSPDGTYSFTNVMNRSNPSTGSFYNYQVSLSFEPGVVGSPGPSDFLLPYAINEGARDYHFQRDYSLQQDITIGTTDLPNVNFNFNQFPKADNVTAPSQPNPDDTSTQITVPTLTGFDPEDSVYNGVSGTNTIAITTIPANGTLFYDGKQITSNDLFYSIYTPPLYFIYNYDPAKLKVHPNPGDQIILFEYYAVDVAKRWSSSPAQVKMTFTSSIASYDYGDAGNLYESAVNPARHRLVAGLQMGQLIDTETAPFLSSYQATGDDISITDDEDGIVSFAPLSTTNNAYSVTVSVLNTLGTDATLSGWIDFNNNGTFDATERAQTTVSSNTANTNVVLSWVNISFISAKQDLIYARFRLASNASDTETPNGLANSGEVEDYTIPVTGLSILVNVLSDANGLTDNTVNGVPIGSPPLPAGPAVFIAVYDAQNNKVGYIYSGTLQFKNLSPGTYRVELNNYDYSSRQPVPFSPTDALSGEHVGTGPGSDGTPDGKITVTLGNTTSTSVTFGINYPPNSESIISAHLTPLGTTQIQIPTLKGWDREDTPSYPYTYDVNITKLIIQTLPANGILYYDGLPVTAGQRLPVPYDQAKLTVDPDGSLPVEFTYSVVDAAGLASEPDPVKLTFRGTGPQVDFGDSPNTYKTLVSNTGPLHTIVNGLQIGNLIDAETNGTPNNTSDGDNITNMNDEDGVTAFPVIPGGSVPQTINSYSVPVYAMNSTSSMAYLSGWIDWNNDGNFGPGEIAQATVPAGTNGSIILTWTNKTLEGAKGATATYARFRLSTDATSVSTPVGDAPDGEVEDYRIPFAAALPIDLVSFQGRWIEGQGNQLSWSTAWERNNDRFEIQSSRDARSFESIGRLTGKGTTTATQTYAFLDAQPLADLIYYRLKQVDTDGQLSYSKIISIRRGVDQTDEQLLVYPNPTSDLLRIQAGKQQNVTDVTIYTASGRRVLHQVGLNSPISVHSLPAGVYVLEVKTLSGQTLRQRFAKQ